MDVKNLRLLLSGAAVLLLLCACGGGAGGDSAAIPSDFAFESLSKPLPALLPARVAPLKTGQIVPTSISNQKVDVFDPATAILTIPLVQVGSRYYRDVQITIGQVQSIGVESGGSGVFDRYDPVTNKLHIPVGRIGATLYFNIVVTVGDLLAVGGAVDSYSVPLNLDQVSYPESYRTITTSATDVNSDPCKLNLSSVTYPATWLGEHPLPPINGAPLKASIKRSVALKDIALNPPDNPLYIPRGAPGAPNGCKGELQSELGKTVARLHQLGADYVTIAQWHYATSNPDGSWYIMKAEDTIGSISDADLRGFVQKAHAAGLKVIMKNQVQSFMAEHPFTPPATAENRTKWFAAYQNYVLERRGFFQEIGVDVWEAGCGACLFSNPETDSPENVAYYADQVGTALSNMKLVFTGQTLINTSSWLVGAPALIARIDILDLCICGLPQGIEASVSAYKRSITTDPNSWHLPDAVSQYDGFGKTIKISYGAQSRRNAFSLTGYVEETACSGLGAVFDPTPNICVQREFATDFSVQAIVHEAILETIKGLTTNSALIVEANDYWETDSLMPFSAFPNLGNSIRNKPAEGIVKAWFAR